MSTNTAEIFDNCPTLSEMGITRVHEISSYTLRQEGKDKDILCVYYKRAKGSLLPYSRKYKFGRSLKTIIADGGTARMQRTYEISPVLLDAMSELNMLVDSNQYANEKPAKITDIKSDLLLEINELAQLLRETQCDSKAVVAKLVNVRQQIETL